MISNGHVTNDAQLGVRSGVGVVEQDAVRLEMDWWIDTEYRIYFRTDVEH